jgi:hypothetical protein
MKRTSHYFLAILLVAVISVSSVFAEIKLPSIFATTW